MNSHHGIFFASLAALVMLSCGVSLSFAQSKEKEAPAPPPGKVEGKIEVVPFEPPHVPTPEVAALLDRLEAAAKATQSLQATVRYDLNQLVDEQKRYGRLIYQDGPPAKFAVHFDTLRVDKKSIPSNRWYIFDGIWLVEKLDDKDKKQFFKWQVVPPNANPANANPLALGKGPFVIPVALRKDLVLDKFKVAIAPPDEKNDPRNSVHLILTPLKGRRINHLRLDLWYDKDSLLPQRARTIDASDTETIIHLSDVKRNAPIEGDPMNTDEPKEPGWLVQITPWEGR